MAICERCHKHVKDGQGVCPNCGARVASSGTENGGIGSILNKGEDFSGAYSSSDISENRLFALMAYIPIVFLYPIFAKMKKSPFVKFHVNEGLVLFLFEVIVSFILRGIILLVSSIPFVAQLLALPLYLVERIVWLAFLFLTISGALNAYKGKAKELVLIGKIRIIK